jgi:hypothetical protein
MFPTGMVGLALFFLRITVAVTVVVDGSAQDTLATSNVFLAAVLVTAVFLCAGVLTPCFAVCAATIDLTALIVTDGTDAFHLVLGASEALILVVLGPGAYSVDARLFGRSLLEIPPRK